MSARRWRAYRVQRAACRGKRRSLARSRRWFLTTAAGLALLPFAQPQLWAQAGRATTVILVRHAEKAAEPASDPGLTPAGEARAQSLVEAARAAGVNAIITSQFLRTKATAAPIASALRLTPEVIDAGGAQHPQAVAQAILTRHAGETVLVVGHSNTIPAIVAALGAPQPPPICDSEYDGLYIVTVPASGEARLIRARYGAATVREGCAPMRP